MSFANALGRTLNTRIVARTVAATENGFTMEFSLDPFIIFLLTERAGCEIDIIK
jgi:hypothetical protein